MTYDDSQRRRNARFRLQRKLTVRVAGQEFVGITRDVNGQGLFFFTAASITEGTEVEILLNLPPGSIFSDQVSLRAAGTAVRVERYEADRTLGVAVAFKQIKISHSSSAATGSFADPAGKDAFSLSFPSKPQSVFANLQKLVNRRKNCSPARNPPDN